MFVFRFEQDERKRFGDRIFAESVQVLSRFIAFQMRFGMSQNVLYCLKAIHRMHEIILYNTVRITNDQVILIRTSLLFINIKATN